MLSVVKMLLKREVGGRALNSHGITSFIMEKLWSCALNFCENPELYEACHENLVLSVLCYWLG